MGNFLPQSKLQARVSGVEPLLNAIAVFILGAMFLFWDASRAAYVLLSLAALVFVVIYRPQMPVEQRFYSWPIIGYFAAALLSLLVNGSFDSGINVLTSRYLLILMAIPLVSIFYLSFNKKRNVWIKYVAGCMVMGALALFDVLYLDKYRASGGHNAAAFGFIALAMTSVVLASYHRFSQVRFGRLVYFLAILTGICAMILSGTRTSWFAGLVVLIIAIFFYLGRYSFCKRVLFVVAFLAGVAIVGSNIPRVQERIDQVVDMVAPYVRAEEQTKFTSLRRRVEVWKLGWHAGLENKLFGFGPDNTNRVIRSYADEYPNWRTLRSINHVHNQFLQSFAMTGLVGLASLFALIICHFWLFTKYLRKRYSLEVRCLALAGLLLLVSYLIKSFPGVPFYGKQYLMMYGFASATIWGSLLGALCEPRSEDSNVK
ncbi:MAG: O-antigen ligase family protein [Gammaproteobacteria bacterium]|nr:O-antigen ligase family protein [Gammaproteobacteria bacterium]